MYCDKARIQCYDNNKHLNTVKPNNKQTHKRRQTGFLLTQKHKALSKHTPISNKQKQGNDLQTHTNIEQTKTKKRSPNTHKY